MAYKIISRRRFIENSVSGGLARWVSIKRRIPGRNRRRDPREPTSCLSKLSVTPRTASASPSSATASRRARTTREENFQRSFRNEDRASKIMSKTGKPLRGPVTPLGWLLRGECKLRNLNATVFVQVEYERITPRIVRKRIRLRQSDMFLVFYQLSNRLEPLKNPSSSWSFGPVGLARRSRPRIFPRCWVSV